AVDEPHHHGELSAAKHARALGEAELASAGALLAQQASQLEQPLARHDDALLHLEVSGRGPLDQGETVPVGRHHPHVALGGLEEYAVQVVAGGLGGGGGTGGRVPLPVYVWLRARRAKPPSPAAWTGGIGL